MLLVGRIFLSIENYRMIFFEIRWWWGGTFFGAKKIVSLFEKCVKVLRTKCVKINMSSLLKVKTYVNKSESLFYIGLHWPFVFLLRI